MADRGEGTEALGATPNGSLSPAEAAKVFAELEQRVTRLEDALATIQDTGDLEDRLVERVTRRLVHDGGRHAEPRHLLIDAGRHLLPAALNQVQDESGRPELSGGRAGRSWLLHHLYTEGQAIIRMFFDRRYQMTWTARVVPLALLVAIITSMFWLPGSGIVVLGTIMDKVFDLLLAFCALKILTREARRYRIAMGEIPAQSEP